MFNANNTVDALSGLSESLGRLALSPIQRWRDATPIHKLLALGAAAGSAYYFHSKGADEKTVALTAVGAAYGASLLLHYPSVMGPQGQAQAGPVVVPPQQLESMAAHATGALRQAQAQSSAQPGPGGLGPLSPSLGSLGEWDGLV